MTILDRLRALDAEATATPWCVSGNSILTKEGEYVIEEVAELASDARLPSDGDVLLIAELRNALPDVLALVEKVLPLVAITRCFRRPNEKDKPDPGPCGKCAACLAKAGVAPFLTDSERGEAGND